MTDMMDAMKAATMTAAVRQIMKQIKALTIEERIALDRQLSADLEKEWRRTMVKMRREAKARGITQATIDEAIERGRYGKSPHAGNP